jgi:hypothetical protein
MLLIVAHETEKEGHYWTHSSKSVLLLLLLLKPDKGKAKKENISQLP